MEPYTFYTLSTITVLAILFMIFQRNPISSAVFLVLSFFSLAGLYAALSAHFVAVLQILVYAGAIMVLFIFVIMLLNLRSEELTNDKINWPRFSILAVALGLFGFLAYHFNKIPKVSFPKVDSYFGTAEEIGEIIFSKYVIPFELIGLLLLVGIVGAVLLGRQEET